MGWGIHFFHFNFKDRRKTGEVRSHPLGFSTQDPQLATSSRCEITGGSETEKRTKAFLGGSWSYSSESTGCGKPEKRCALGGKASGFMKKKEGVIP